MKRILTVTLMAALALFASSAFANFCARDVVPANTLLVPYVVVSMTGQQPDPAGYTTLLSVTNTSSTVAIIHVVVWNAVSDGILDFDEVLSGYDVWTINFKDLLSGHWSAFQTSLSASAPPNVAPIPLSRTPFEWGPDGRSAFGGVAALPTPDKTSALNAVAFASCNTKIPFLNDSTGSVYAPVVVQRLQEPLFARTHGGCVGTGTLNQPVQRHLADWLSTQTNNPIVFYVTIDNFRVCDLKFPNEAGYFVNDQAYSNVLIGEVYYLNFTSQYSESFPAVHIESDLDSGAMATATTQFYQEKSYDWANTVFPTYLEPLGTAFGFRYFNEAPLVTSSVLLWKNATEFYTDDTVVDCGSYLYYAWDQDEHTMTRGTNCPVSPCAGIDIDGNEFPYEVQAVPLSTDNFDLPDKYGWMLIVFPPSYDLAFVDPTPETYGLLTFDYYAWVGVSIRYQGFSTSIEAATMASAHCFETQILPKLGINYNYTDGNHVPAWW
jgi:hypothetical protein